MRRGAGAMLLLASLAGCASRPAQETSRRHDSVDQRMLPAAPVAAAAGALAQYEMGASEAFRMPRALETGNPQLPVDSPRQALAPTTVCARVIVSASGQVVRVEPLTDRDECRAGAADANADLMRVTLDKLTHWRFEPAAVCTFAAGMRRSSTADDCKGAQRIEAVPVTLSFAFTFEVAQGRASVRSGRMGR